MSQPAVPADTILFKETVRGGGMWSGILKRHQTLRLTALQPGANVSALFFNSEEKLERYNMPDTLKAQHTAFLTRGNVLYSDMGRILCSITADSCGWHDTICGCSNPSMVMKKYGQGSFQELRNGFYRNGRDNFLIELGKWGLGKRDLTANVNFFSKVTINETGQLKFHSDHCRENSYVDLRAELNVLVVLNTCQHPLDPSLSYAPVKVEISIHTAAAPPGADDFCRNYCPENGRGFINTERFFL